MPYDMSQHLVGWSCDKNNLSRKQAEVMYQKLRATIRGRKNEPAKSN